MRILININLKYTITYKYIYNNKIYLYTKHINYNNKYITQYLKYIDY